MELEVAEGEEGGKGMSVSLILTVSEVASLLKVHEKTVRRLFDRGELRRFKIGGQVRVRTADLEEYIDEQIRRTGSK